MPPIALARHLPRTAVAAALAGVLVLAEGLSALAEGGTPLPGRLRAPDAAFPAPSFAAEVTAPASTDPPTPWPNVPAERMRPLSAAAQAAAMAADPPPFAPGGDDILGGEPSDPVRPLNLHDDGAPSSAIAAALTSALAPSAPALPGPGRATAPALRLWLDQVVTAEGTRRRLNVSPVPDGGCQLAGAVQGRLPSDGRRVLPELPPGRHHVGVRCRSGGAVAEGGVTVAVPLPVLAGSLANRRQHARADAVREGLRAFGLAAADGGPLPWVAAGDFFQEGRAAVVAAEAGGLLRVVAADDAGRWHDRTAELLPWPADRRGCASPRQLLSADLDRDGLPDLVLTCAEAPPVVFLGQPGGAYRRLDTAVPPADGPLELLDADGDGLIDLVQADPSAGLPPLRWRGLGDGGFIAP